MADTTKAVGVPEWIRKCGDRIAICCSLSFQDYGQMIAEIVAKAYAPEAARLRRELLALADKLTYAVDVLHDASGWSGGQCNAGRSLRDLVDANLPEQTK